MNIKIKKLCLIAMGIALFVALSFCIRVPVFENYYICLGYVVMMAYCYTMGPLAGMFVGFYGVVLYCLLSGGINGLPGWSIGNIVVALIVGSTCVAVQRIKNTNIKHVLIILSIVIANVVGILIIKSFIEYLIYAEPIAIRIAKNIYACVADCITMIVGLSICPIFQKLLTKYIK